MAAAGSSSSSSRFAVTCGLLSQYMRERQQPPVTLLEAVAEEVEGEDDRTMQLFPPRAAAAVATPSAGTATAPLTIFYDGRVVVFDDVPAEKAAELMRMAGSACSPAPPAPKPVQPAHAAALPEMPIARKASLQRFLQKRKHRITTTSDPYKKAAVASPPPEKSFAAAAVVPVKDEPATWLGL
uniref:Protein TIFY n=1 Tax=Oryza punctata TaxID=4537 RepID=A0A0E0M794_ORYPU